MSNGAQLDWMLPKENAPSEHSRKSRGHIFWVSLRQRRNPRTANERENAKKAIATAFSPVLDPLKDKGNKSGQQTRTSSPPKPPSKAPTKIQSKFPATLLIGQYSLEARRSISRFDNCRKQAIAISKPRPPGQLSVIAIFQQLAALHYSNSRD
jgi:hypothetical protein